MHPGPRDSPAMGLSTSTGSSPLFYTWNLKWSFSNMILITPLAFHTWHFPLLWHKNPQTGLAGGMRWSPRLAFWLHLGLLSLLQAQSTSLMGRALCGQKAFACVAFSARNILPGAPWTPFTLLIHPFTWLALWFSHQGVLYKPTQHGVFFLSHTHCGVWYTSVDEPMWSRCGSLTALCRSRGQGTQLTLGTSESLGWWPVMNVKQGLQQYRRGNGPQQRVLSLG